MLGPPGQILLPCAISALARLTDSLNSRICSRIILIFSANRLNACAICAASSAPSAGRRFVRSPLPVETSVSASRTSRMRLKAAFVIAPTSAAAITATIRIAASVVVATARMPAVTSALSSASTRDQSVPAIGCPAWWRRRCRPRRPDAVCSAPRWSASSAGESPVAGFIIRSVLADAITRPLLSTRNAKLAGVGCTEVTIGSRSP